MESMSNNTECNTNWERLAQHDTSSFLHTFLAEIKEIQIAHNF